MSAVQNHELERKKISEAEAAARALVKSSDPSWKPEVAHIYWQYANLFAAMCKFDLMSTEDKYLAAKRAEVFLNDMRWYFKEVRKSRKKRRR
jgi:hypothetical protein